MDFWASERSQVRTLQASLHEKTLIFSVFSVFDLGCYWLTDEKQNKAYWEENVSTKLSSRAAGTEYGDKNLRRGISFFELPANFDFHKDSFLSKITLARAEAEKSIRWEAKKEHVYGYQIIIA